MTTREAKAALNKIDRAIGVQRRIKAATADLERERNKLVREAQEAVPVRADGHLSYRAIAELMGVAKATVQEWIRLAREN